MCVAPGGIVGGGVVGVESFKLRDSPTGRLLPRLREGGRWSCPCRQACSFLLPSLLKNMHEEKREKANMYNEGPQTVSIEVVDDWS